MSSHDIKAATFSDKAPLTARTPTPRQTTRPVSPYFAVARGCPDWEMSLAGWLIVEGFRATAITSGATQRIGMDPVPV